MANTKGYSVARTQGGAMSAANTSTVYSYSGIPGTSWHCGRNGAYDGKDANSMAEGGRVPTLASGLKAIADHDVTSNTLTTAGDARADLKSTKCVCTTTTTKGNGAGLIVSFTTNSSGNIAGTVAVVDGGESYAASDTVTVDGFPNSKLTVAVS